MNMATPVCFQILLALVLSILLICLCDTSASEVSLLGPVFYQIKHVWFFPNAHSQQPLIGFKINKVTIFSE